MKTNIFIFLFACILAANISLSAQSNVNFSPSRDIIRDSIVRVIDRQDISTQTELIPIPETTYKGVNDLIALPNPVQQGEMLTLSFWINEANTFTVTIGNEKGTPIEVQKIGSLARGAHNLSIEIGMLNPGNYSIEVNGETDIYGKTKFTVKE